MRDSRYAGGMLVLLALLAAPPEPTVTGTLEPWRPITVSMTGPETSETAEQNPFSDHRVTVTFRSPDSGEVVVVPGFFAADGDAANTSAEAGNVWRARFSTGSVGRWVYTVSHEVGPDAAIDEGAATEPGMLDGVRGEFTVSKSSAKPTGQSFYRLGRIEYVGKRYYRAAGTGTVWLKAGNGSPENLLAFVDFDGTTKHGRNFEPVAAGLGEERERPNDLPNKGATLHEFAPHADDWTEGDPTWGDGRGKNLIGLVNYLAASGLRSSYFLTMNVTGDGKDVWPWIGAGPDSRDRFDVSKLAQWEIVFRHMQANGIAMHVMLQETENDQLLDDGETGRLRKLYLRELCARFAHHPAVLWNIGEENTQTAAQVEAMSAYIDRVDGYDHPRVMHTYPNKKEEGYAPLLGSETLEGASLQSHVGNVPADTLEWIRRSEESGNPWVVSCDEIGPASTGVMPDADDPDHDEPRRYAIWGHFLSGGAGIEWYFGYKYAHHDLTAEDLRSRDEVWRQSKVALDFMASIPVEQMDPQPELTEAENDYVLADRGVVYAIYYPKDWFASSPEAMLNTLDAKARTVDHSFTVQWLDAKAGGELQTGSVETVASGERVSIGAPPSKSGDWVALVRKSN